MTNLIEIDVLDDVLDEKYWSICPPQKHMSRHSYRNSPYESDESCANCDGVNCEICKEIITPTHLECAIPVNILEDLFISRGVPKKDISNIIYNENCNNISGKYIFNYPDEYMLEARYKDFYEKILARDNDIWNELDNYKASGLNPIIEAENKRNIRFLSDDPHLSNQITLWSINNDR